MSLIEREQTEISTTDEIDGAPEGMNEETEARIDHLLATYNNRLLPSEARAISSMMNGSSLLEILEQVEQRETRIQQLLATYEHHIMFRSTGATPDMTNRAALLEILETIQTSLKEGNMMRRDSDDDID